MSAWHAGRLSGSSTGRENVMTLPCVHDPVVRCVPLSSSIGPNRGRSKSAAATDGRSGREPVKTEPLPHRPQIDPLSIIDNCAALSSNPGDSSPATAGGLWKLPAFQSLRPNAKTRPVPVQDLHQVPAAVEEHKQMARGRLLPEHRFGQRDQPRESPSACPSRPWRGTPWYGARGRSRHCSPDAPADASIVARMRPKAVGSKIAGTRITCPRG